MSDEAHLDQANNLTEHDDMNFRPPAATPAAENQASNPMESDEMNFRQLAATAALSAGAATALSGCEAHDYSNVKFQPNPNPKERYELTVKVDGAPGLFKDVSGDTSIQLANLGECTPPRDSFTGAPQKGVRNMGGVDVKLTQTSETTWRGEFSVDGMLEAPYYGYAVCRWYFNAVEVSLMATGAKGETIFSADLNLAQVREEKPVTLYFNKRMYPRSPVDPAGNNYVFFGKERSRYGLPDTDLFTITLSARKVTP
jgi:hypothetical protein